MRKIIGIGIFLLLLIHLNGQITLYKVPWRGNENKEISLDSILQIPTDTFFLQILQEIKEQPFCYAIYGRFGKVFLLYDGQILIEDFSRNFNDFMLFNNFVSNISDKILQAMLPYLSPKTIYKLEIFINIEEMTWCKEDEEEHYFLQYEKEKDVLMKKAHHVISLYACRRYPSLEK